jgi:putative hydrolase of the HAD superfamily
VQYKHIFWDLDHTLWHFEQNSVRSLQLVYNQCALADKGITDFNDFDAVYHQINDQMWDRFRKGFIGRQEMRWKRMAKTLMHYKIFDETLAKDMGEQYLEFLPQQNALLPYAIEILDYCAEKKCKQHIITNGFEATQWQKMRNARIDQYFDKVITSEEAMALKPKPEIYAFALQQTGADLAASIMIGDAVDVDVKGAIDFGMHAVWFNPHGLVSQQTRTHEIKSLKELELIL